MRPDSESIELGVSTGWEGIRSGTSRGATQCLQSLRASSSLRSHCSTRGASVPLTATGTLRWKKHAHYMGESMSYIRRAECTVLPRSLTSPTSKILGGLAGCARRRALARRTTRVSIQAGHHPLMRMNRPSWAVWMSGPYPISCCARPCVPAPRSRCACKCRAQGLAGARDIRYVGEGADGAIACVLTFEGELDDAQRRGWRTSPSAPP